MKSFKACTACNAIWQSRPDFLGDPEIVLRGYQPSFAKLGSGLFLFMHLVPHCRTTFGIPVSVFADLHNGIHFPHSALGTDQCKGHCLNQEDLAPCKENCANRYARDIMQAIIALQNNNTVPK